MQATSHEPGSGRCRMVSTVCSTGAIVSILLLAGLSLARPAGAATIGFTDQFALSDAEIAGSLSVPKFDPALGTLTGVSWSITGAIASILGLQNDSAQAVTLSAFTSVDFNIDSAELALGASPDFNVFASTGLVTLGVGESALFPVTAQTTITGSETPSGAFLLPGTVDLSFLSTTSFGGMGTGSDITISQATDAGVSFSITYEFTPIPEPSSLLLLGGGLLGAAAARRRAEST